MNFYSIHIPVLDRRELGEVGAHLREESAGDARDQDRTADAPAEFGVVARALAPRALEQDEALRRPVRRHAELTARVVEPMGGRRDLLDGGGGRERRRSRVVLSFII